MACQRMERILSAVARARYESKVLQALSLTRLTIQLLLFYFAINWQMVHERFLHNLDLAEVGKNFTCLQGMASPALIAIKCT